MRLYNSPLRVAHSQIVSEQSTQEFLKISYGFITGFPFAFHFIVPCSSVSLYLRCGGVR